MKENSQKVILDIYERGSFSSWSRTVYKFWWLPWNMLICFANNSYYWFIRNYILQFEVFVSCVKYCKVLFSWKVLPPGISTQKVKTYKEGGREEPGGDDKSDKIVDNFCVGGNISVLSNWWVPCLLLQRIWATYRSSTFDTRKNDIRKRSIILLLDLLQHVVNFYSDFMSLLSQILAAWCNRSYWLNVQAQQCTSSDIHVFFVFRPKALFSCIIEMLARQEIHCWSG